MLSFERFKDVKLPQRDVTVEVTIPVCRQNSGRLACVWATVIMDDVRSELCPSATGTWQDMTFAANLKWLQSKLHSEIYKLYQLTGILHTKTTKHNIHHYIPHIMSFAVSRTVPALRSAMKAGGYGKRAAGVATTTFVRGKATLPDLACKLLKLLKL